MALGSTLPQPRMHGTGTNSARAGRRRSRLTGVIAGAVALGGLALWNTYRARKAERENPPMGRFVTVDGVRLHYLERGAGKPVVLLHGNIVTADDFELSGLLDLLADRGYRAIAFDRQGYGHSDRPRGSGFSAGDQAAVLRKALVSLEIERPIVVGHSWGAHLALALALDAPESVGGLVLLSGYYYPTIRADVPLASIAAIPVLGDVLRYTLSPLFTAAALPAIYRVMFGPREVPERFKKGFPSRLSVRPSQIRAEAQDGASMIPGAVAMQRRYSELDLPVAIIAGADDRVVNVGRHALRLHRDIPRSRILVVPNVGHMTHWAVSEQIAEAVGEASQERGASMEETSRIPGPVQAASGGPPGHATP